MITRLARAAGLGLLCALIPAFGFTRQQGPTTLEAHRATGELPFEVTLTLRRGPFASVETFSAAEPRGLFSPKTRSAEPGFGTFELLSPDGGLPYPVYSSSFEDEGEPNEKNLGPMLVGMRAYGDAWQTHQLDFRWTFPAETSFWPLLALTVLAFAAGVALGLFSGRRGT